MQTFAFRIATSVAVVVLVLCTAIGRAQPHDPIVGVWALNLAKSTFATPAPRSQTVTVAPAARGYTITIDVIGPDDTSLNWGYASIFDGSESPVSGNPGVDAVIATSDGARGTVRYKKAGSVITTTESVVSDDGKTLTVTIKIPDGQGREMISVAVYERQ